ncbi:MAG: glycyl-radical enzyme activating protein [Pseudomonadota bacterium]
MTTDPESLLTGTVLEIQRMSTEDGPGLRTTVFFKGCTLRCDWCHNPESIAARPELQWVAARCIGCRTCLEVCSCDGLSAAGEGIVIHRERCTGCGDCAQACPSTALEIMGHRWAVNDLAREVLKDRAYFLTSGGGVTASGGEAAMQAGFVAAFLAACRGAGVHTAIDTGGHVQPEAYRILLPQSDLVLFDIKMMDAEAHRCHTGAGNRLIFENLQAVATAKRTTATPSRIWIRTPIIPGATDTEANIAAIGRYIAAHLPGDVTRWELCAFNNLCRDKYRQLGRPWAYGETALIPEAHMAALADTARDSGVDPSIVVRSGATR